MKTYLIALKTEVERDGKRVRASSSTVTVTGDVERDLAIRRYQIQFEDWALIFPRAAWETRDVPESNTMGGRKAGPFTIAVASNDRGDKFGTIIASEAERAISLTGFVV